MNYIHYDVNGRIVRCGELEFANPEKYSVLITEQTVTPNSFYVQNDALVTIPPSPSKYCIFDYVTKTWVDPRTPDTQWPIVREQRDKLLQESDYTQLPDVPLPDKQLWATYRQELRDVTKQPDPFNIIWPTKPQG